MNLSESFAAAQIMIETGCLSTAQKIYRKALRHCSEPMDRARISYEFGVLYWRQIGDGAKARRCFRLTVEICAMCEETKNLEDREMETYAYDNLMLLSLSEDEYGKWVDRAEKSYVDLIRLRSSLSFQEHDRRAKNEEKLQLLRDNLHNLLEHKGEVLDRYYRGLLWLEVLHEQTHAYFVQGLYANVAATCQLILKYKQQLVLSPNDLKRVTLTYAEVILEITRHCDFAMRRIRKRVDPQEFIFIVEDAIPFVEEYVNAGPADDQAQELLQDLRGVLTLRTNNQSSEFATNAGAPRAMWWLYVLGTVIGALLGYFPSQEAWGAILGGLSGMVIGVVWARITRNKQEVSFPSSQHRARSERRRGATEASGQPHYQVNRTVQVFQAENPQSIHGHPSGPELVWQTSDSLKRAIASVGLDGVEFELVEVGIAAVDDGFSTGDELRLSFQTINSVPRGKEHEAGLALRCIVGLTLPLVATCTGGLKADILPMPYMVNLGSMVPMSSIVLTSKAGQTAPLAAKSREEGSNWYVELKSLILPRGDMERLGLVHKQVFEQLKPTFERLKLQHIILAG